MQTGAISSSLLNHYFSLGGENKSYKTTTNHLQPKPVGDEIYFKWIHLDFEKKMFHIFCLVWHQVEEMCTPDTEHKTVFTKVNRCNWDGQRKEWVSCCWLQKKRKNIFCYITYTQNIAFSFFASTTLNTNTLLTIAAMMFWPNYIPHWNLINKGLGENDTLQKSCKYLLTSFHLH